jgi:F0F1-type ATP synthase assembly protein I
LLSRGKTGERDRRRDACNKIRCKRISCVIISSWFIGPTLGLITDKKTHMPEGICVFLLLVTFYNANVLSFKA